MSYRRFPSVRLITTPHEAIIESQYYGNGDILRIVNLIDSLSKFQFPKLMSELEKLTQNNNLTAEVVGSLDKTYLFLYALQSDLKEIDVNTISDPLNDVVNKLNAVTFQANNQSLENLQKCYDDFKSKISNLPNKMNPPNLPLLPNQFQRPLIKGLQGPVQAD